MLANLPKTYTHFIADVNVQAVFINNCAQSLRHTHAGIVIQSKCIYLATRPAFDADFKRIWHDAGKEKESQSPERNADKEKRQHNS